MDKVIDSVNTPDGFFHDGNSATGELGTIVEAILMNAWQSAIKSILSENETILKAAGITPDNKSFNQLKLALDKMYATTSHGHADLVPTTRKVNNKVLNKDITLTAAEIGAVTADEINTFTSGQVFSSQSESITLKSDENSSSYIRFKVGEKNLGYIGKGNANNDITISNQIAASKIHLFENGDIFIASSGANVEISSLLKFNGKSVLTTETGVVSTRTINNKPLSSNISLTAADIGIVSVGVGQKWKNVSASRTMGVTYTNTTGKPIMISVTYSQSFDLYCNIYVDNIAINQARIPNVVCDITLTAIVPVGSTYKVVGSANNKNMWFELS